MNMDLCPVSSCLACGITFPPNPVRFQVSNSAHLFPFNKFSTLSEASNISIFISPMLLEPI